MKKIKKFYFNNYKSFENSKIGNEQFLKNNTIWNEAMKFKKENPIYKVEIWEQYSFRKFRKLCEIIKPGHVANIEKKPRY